MLNPFIASPLPVAAGARSNFKKQRYGAGAVTHVTVSCRVFKYKHAEAAPQFSCFTVDYRVEFNKMQNVNLVMCRSSKLKIHALLVLFLESFQH